MAKNLELQFQLKANDRASRTFKTAANQAKRSMQEVENASQKAVRVSEKAAKARQALNIRSERDIQREIKRTEIQYERLKRSGMATSRELARAHEQVKNRVRELNAEMGKTPTGQRLGNIARGAMGVGAGIIAGSMVMAEPVRKSMGYDRDLAMVANTAFSDRDVAGRIAGKKELHQSIETAVKTGGGTKEEALGAIDTLLASGTVSANTAMALLPTLQKGAVATGASAEDLAKIAVSSMQQFGIKEQDIGKVLDMAVAAGQAGNFELRDMAKWLPQQMAAAKQMGLTGSEGLQALLVANQQARVTAGSSDEAGNNLVNLLAKITSKETNERFEDLEYVDRKGKKRKINYLKTMEGYKSQGKNSLEAFMAIMDDVVGADENYKVLQEKLKTARGEEQRALLDQMTNFVEGTAIGQIISDRQALMALLGIRNNVRLGEEVKTQIANSEGSTDKSHAVIKDTNDYKVNALKSSTEFAQMEGLKKFNDILGDTSEVLVDYMSKYPELSSTLVGLGTGVKALGVAALAAAGAVTLLGNKNGLSLPDFGRGNNHSQRNGRNPQPRAGRVGGKWLSGASKLLSVAGIASATMALGEEQPYQQARSEMDKEKQDNAKLQFGQGVSALASKPMGFQPVPFVPQGITSKGVALYGGYALAALKHDDDVAKARYELGGYSKPDLDARLQRNAQLKARYTQPQAVDSVENVAKSIGEFATSIGDIVSQQGSMQGVLDSVTTTLSQYQADFNAFGQMIGEGLRAGLAAQSHTIDNYITVELEGRVIAESTAQHFFRFDNRGQV